MQAAFGSPAWQKVREARSLLDKKSNKDVPWRPMGLFVGMLVPVLLFAHTYYCIYGSWRWVNFSSAMFFGPALAFAACGGAAFVAWTSFRNGMPMRNFGAMSLCMWVAFAGALILGERNFQENMASYLSYEDMASYVNIDPSKDKGQSYMDAGIVYFREGAAVQTRDGSLFHSDGDFCVAPILSYPVWRQSEMREISQRGALVLPESGTVDFWAVGTNCCNSTHFFCGQASMPRARSGMRLLRDDTRPFYALAVQAWTAKMCGVNDNTAKKAAQQAPIICLPARHPLFFHWVEDPLEQVDAFYKNSQGQFHQDLFLFTVADFVLLLGVTFGLHAMGIA